MPRGPLRPETKKQRALDAAAQWMQSMGVDITVDTLIEQAAENPETEESKIIEAQAVAYYFATGGRGYKYKNCKVCKKRFAYNWNVDSITCCSIPCMAKQLEEMGLKWDPRREYSRRWGRYYPAIVPPAALENIQRLLADIRGDHTENKPS